MAFKVRAESDRTILYLYDVIHDEIGVSASEFVSAVESAESPIELRINSPGGDAWAGKAMADAVQNSTLPVTAYADGLVASAATLPAVAADSFHMRQGSQFVIHEAWTVTVGGKTPHRSNLSQLEAGDTFLIDAYEQKSGKDRDEIDAMLATDTWFDSKAAIEAGFADSEIAEIGLAALIPKCFRKTFGHMPGNVAISAEVGKNWIPQESKTINEDRRRETAQKMAMLIRLSGG